MTSVNLEQGKLLPPQAAPKKPFGRRRRNRTRAALEDALGDKTLTARSTEPNLVVAETVKDPIPEYGFPAVAIGLV
jgi:hypothetical protein